MELKITKGEWYKMNASQMGVPFIIASGNETLFQVYGEDAEHNANLVLSAPEMFDELVKIMVNYDKGTDTYIRIEKLLTKITK